MQSRTVDVDGPVHVSDFGGSGPPMVLVHGLGGAALNWLGVGPALARRARVLALDLPGFGWTPLAGRSASLPAQRAFLGRFLACVVGAPAIIVGNSMGGLIAMMEASVEPVRVAALVLAAPAQPAPAGARIDLAVLAAFGAYALPWLGEWYFRRRAARLGPEGLVREMFRLCCVDPSRVGPELRAAHVALATDRLERMPWATPAFLDAARSTLAAIRNRRAYYEMAGRITAPVLLIQGAGDRLIPLSASRALARRRPAWQLEVFEDLGHVPQLEDPKRFVETLERWLDGTLLAIPGRIP